MKLQLTPAQAEQIAPLLKVGVAVLGRITRESFDGTNAESCGSLCIEVGEVPEQSLPALREAIREASNPSKLKKAKRKP